MVGSYCCWFFGLGDCCFEDAGFWVYVIAVLVLACSCFGLLVI